MESGREVEKGGGEGRRERGLRDKTQIGDSLSVLPSKKNQTTINKPCKITQTRACFTHLSMCF